MMERLLAALVQPTSESPRLRIRPAMIVLVFSSISLLTLCLMPFARGVPVTSGQCLILEYQVTEIYRNRNESYVEIHNMTHLPNGTVLLNVTRADVYIGYRLLFMDEENLYKETIRSSDSVEERIYLPYFKIFSNAVALGMQWNSSFTYVRRLIPIGGDVREVTESRTFFVNVSKIERVSSTAGSFETYVINYHMSELVVFGRTVRALSLWRTNYYTKEGLLVRNMEFYPLEGNVYSIRDLIKVRGITTTESLTSSTSSQITFVSSSTAVTSTSKTVTSPVERQCMIASAAYGSELATDVQLLRIFRDKSVRPTHAGSSFMNMFDAFYYSFSPTVASAMLENSILRQFVKTLIRPLVAALGVAFDLFDLFRHTAEAAVILSGVVASSLIGIIYLVPLISLITLLRKEAKKRAKRYPKLLLILASSILVLASAFLALLSSSAKPVLSLIRL
mgnify:CR=1 FL=1